MLGVAGGGEHVDAQRAHLDDVAAADPLVGDRDPLVGGDEVVGAVPPGQQRRPRHVVVVDVGVGDGGDLDPRTRGGLLDDDVVAGRVDHQGAAAVALTAQHLSGGRGLQSTS